jgi:cytoskeletal protein RodZ
MPKPSSTEDQENQSQKSKPDLTLVIAIVTLIGTVITAIFASPVLVAWIQKTPDIKTANSQPTSNSSASPKVEQPTPRQSSPSPDAPVTSASTLASPRTVCIISFDKPQMPVLVDVSSLSFSGGTFLPLASGQSIPFAEMRQFQITDVITSPPLVISVTAIKIKIMLLDGTILSDELNGNGNLSGKTKFGGFGKSLDKIKQVEFKEQSAC